jgi:tropomyosin
VQLRAEVDAAIERAETAEKKNKDLEQTVLERDHEVKSLGVRLEHAEDALEKSEAALKETTAKCVLVSFPLFVLLALPRLP